MTRYEFASLTVQMGTAGKALAGMEQYFKANAGKGKLFAVWSAEIGMALNQFLIVRGFDSSDAMHDERQRMLESGDLFGVSDCVANLSFEAFQPFPFFPPLQAGSFGTIYEVRYYGIKPTGIRPVLSAWEAALPERLKLSKILLAGYALDGVTPRMVHICPYNGVDERTRIRGDAVAAGIWPPKGGPDWLTTMQVWIYNPTKFSPLR
jgi:NIPSNAP protein